MNWHPIHGEKQYSSSLSATMRLDGTLKKTSSYIKNFGEGFGVLLKQESINLNQITQRFQRLIAKKEGNKVTNKTNSQKGK